MTLAQKSKITEFKPTKDTELKWETFNGGWNTFSRTTELKPNELAQADNLMLVGIGTPTGRWGSEEYHLAGTGRVRMLDAYYNSLTSTNELLTITDSGYLTKKVNASYGMITGASFASGYNYQSVELGGNTYIAAASQNFIKFNGTNLIPYVGLSTPTNVSVAFMSGATGYTTFGWRVDATSQTGQTIASTSVTLANLPLSMVSANVKVSWDTVSAAASVLTGYNIYRGFPGNETYIASVDAVATSYLDQGDPASDVIFPSYTNTTAGPQAKYIIKVEDRLVMAGLRDDPSKVLISGRYPDHDKFTAVSGGGWVYVSPDDGEEVTGLGLQNLQTVKPLIIVYKQNATYIIDLQMVTLGAFNILDPQVHLITRTAGASSGDGVAPVENDSYSFGRKGLYSTGQEPEYLNQIRSNEITARIRPYVRSLTDNDFKEAACGYMDYKYLLSFPSRKETIIYDRQRTAFMGPWKTPFGITKWLRYFDPGGNEIWLAGCTDGYVRYFSDSLVNDSGTAISRILRTKKESMGDWNMMKMLKYFYFLLRNVRGTVTVNLRIEGRDGNTVVTKTATITSSLGDGGWGGDDWGTALWGDTDATVTLSGEELARYSLVYKQFRVLQVEVVASGSNANFEFVATRASATSLGPQSLSTKLKI